VCFAVRVFLPLVAGRVVSHVYPSGSPQKFESNQVEITQGFEQYLIQEECHHRQQELRTILFQQGEDDGYLIGYPTQPCEKTSDGSVGGPLDPLKNYSSEQQYNQIQANTHRREVQLKPFYVIETTKPNSYKVYLPGEYGAFATFNVAELSPYLEKSDERPSLRTNFSQVGEDDGDHPHVLSLVKAVQISSWGKQKSEDKNGLNKAPWPVFDPGKGQL